MKNDENAGRLRQVGTPTSSLSCLHGHQNVGVDRPSHQREPAPTPPRMRLPFARITPTKFEIVENLTSSLPRAHEPGFTAVRLRRFRPIPEDMSV